MSREIKFKVWDTENEEYSNWTNRDPHFNVTNSRLFFWERTQKKDGSYGGDIVLEDYGNRFILLQYTGLKDKNGKEIYEGDILIFRPCYDESLGGQFGNSVFAVSFSDGAFRFGDQLADQEGASYYEIIGHIYQNPELLKQ